MSNPRKKPAPIRTELQLTKLKPGATRIDIPVSIAPGLHVRIFPSGTKTFRWDRGRQQKPRIVTYGKFPDMSLAEAVKAHNKNKQKHKEGIAVDVHAANAKTVAELAEQFYSKRIVPHRKRPDVVRNVLDKDILPSIGRAKVGAITPAIIRGVVEAVVARGAPTHAGKVLAILKQLFRFGVSNGTLEYNPASELDALALGVENNVRNRVLNDNELHWLWNTLDEAKRITPTTKNAVKLLLLLGLRSGELRLSEWKHYDEKNKTLTIPPEHQKLSPRVAASARAFVVPLSPVADQLIRELIGNDKRWIFSVKAGLPIERRSWGRAVTRMIQLTKGTDNPIDHFSIHDLRRTMRSRLGALGIAPHLAERCLNHSLGRILHIYDQHDYLNERREALKEWENHLCSIVRTDNH